MAEDNWSRQEEERLETLFRQGKSFAEIGRRLGRSRLAVGSKCDRMKLKRRRTKQQTGADWGLVNKIRLRARKSSPTAPPKHFAVAAEDLNRPGVGIMELSATACRWPIREVPFGSKEDQRFCGRRREPGQSYCSDHCKRAYRGHDDGGEVSESERGGCEPALEQGG